MDWIDDRLGEKTGYTLMVALTDPEEQTVYSFDSKAETPSELDARMDELDKEGKRWCLMDENDKWYFEYRVCDAHKKAIGLIISRKIRGGTL